MIGCGLRNGLQYGGVAANIFNKQLRTVCKGWSSSLEVGGGVNFSPSRRIMLRTIPKENLGPVFEHL
jgi:hypothetical protein